MPAGILLDRVEEVVAVVLEIFETANREILFIAPPAVLSLAGTFDTVERAERFIQKAGVLKGITTITRANAEEVRLRLAAGVALRHRDTLGETFMCVGDRQQSVSALNIYADDIPPDFPISAFWSESSTYAEYLLTSFESAWSQAVPAKERTQELEREAGQR